MKLLTLNTHSLVEENYDEKLKIFSEAIASEKPDIIALQEVNQSISHGEIHDESLFGFTPCGIIPVRGDNHACNAVKLLYEKGVRYYWTWLGMKESYGKYQEGISLLSLSPVTEVRTHTLSGIDNYSDWKTRKVIGIRTEKYPDDWFYSVHFGWWNDSEEPFQPQWKKLCRYLPHSGRVWLMGDFNSPSEVRGEGYDMMKNDGWHDSFTLATEKDSGITVPKSIDGWHDRISGTQGMRIDHIWCSERAEITSSQVIFNGSNYPVVSDHYGIIIKTKD